MDEVRDGCDEGLPTPQEILDVHEEIEEEYGLAHTGVSAVLPKQALQRVIEKVQSHDEVYRRAAALLRHLTTAHVFEDGNKRTAWTVTRLYLQKHDADAAVRRPDKVANVLRRIKRFDVDELADWLATGDIDQERLDP